MRKFQCLFNESKLDGWSSEKAYFLGLIVTDGTIVKRPNSLGYHYVQIKLASKDRDILEKLSLWLEFEGKLYESVTRHKSGKVTEALTLALVSEKLDQLMNEFNLSNNKTKCISRLSIPSEYMRDFIRGFVDGDGSIHARYVLTISSWNKEPLEQISDFIRIETGVEGKLFKETIWRLEYSRKEFSIPVLEWLYSTGISMDRKREQALSMSSKVQRGFYGSRVKL